MKLAHLTVIGRIIIGVLFLISGIAKIISPAPAATILQNFLSIDGVASWLVPFAFATAEVILGALLLIGKFTLPASLFSSLFFLTAISVGVRYLDEPLNCGCFGNLLNSKTDEFFLIRNLLFLGISLFVVQNSSFSFKKTGEKI